MIEINQVWARGGNQAKNYIPNRLPLLHVTSQINIDVHYHIVDESSEIRVILACNFSTHVICQMEVR